MSRVIFEAALAFGNGEPARGQATGAILLAIETRKMLPDDLFGRVTLDALGAGVPVAYHTLGIEHVDRVIGDTLDQQAETLLAVAQLFLGVLSLGEIARDLGEPQQSAILVANGFDHDVRPEAAAVLAHAPAFGLEFACARSRLQRPLGQAGLAIDILVKALEVLSQDLGRRVALEALGAGIPADDVAARIEHVNGVVGHGLNEELKTRRVAESGLSLSDTLDHSRFAILGL
jgi:hypothetical protein